ncbi:MAG TPA: M28 family peptidase [Candidatus Acidoferrales bacterium]|nr:M28 family peptidase [Candidatus Acidoferrales bacterium]
MNNALRSYALAGAVVLTLGATASTADQRNEATFLAIPSSDGARASSQALNQSYHYPGTPGDRQMAIWMRDRLAALGLNARIESFPAVVYTPKTLQLQLMTSPAVTFDLADPAIPADSGGSRPGIGLPFNAGSGDGDVTAALVDAGKGLDADYARLKAMGVNVRGKIALVRYGAEYRGNLALRAQQDGAAGVVFFTDPSGNKGPAYPNGPYPSDLTIQRGEVMGDDNLPLRIPVLPIDARNARVLIANIRNGQTASPVHERVVMNATHTTLWNSIGEIAGSNPKQSVVLGGHRDAWVYGVSDDGSGIATLLEVARGLGKLHRGGWTPKRTIVIAGWDAEEIGELGSTAYVNAHKADLQNGCIAYLNTDESASGPDFGASAAAAISDGVTGPIQSVLGIGHPVIDPPSGGSDFESFIYTMGTPIFDVGYTGALGTYHSPYDDFRFASLYADPGFVHHKTIAQALGIVAMRLAQSDRPFAFAPYATALDSGAREMIKEAAKAGLILNAPKLADAIRHVEDAASRVDERQSPENVPIALKAAQHLDLIAYSANGYASVAFPTIAKAIASGKQSELDDAVRDTIAALERVSALLHETGA